MEKQNICSGEGNKGNSEINHDCKTKNRACFYHRDLKTLDMPTLQSSTPLQLHSPFLINISPYLCSASFLFPHVTASNFQRVCREYGSTLSAVGIFSWAVDEMIEMTCVLPDVTMHKSSSVGSQLQWFSNGTGPHQCEWSLSHIILG